MLDFAPKIFFVDPTCFSMTRIQPSVTIDTLLMSVHHFYYKQFEQQDKLAPCCLTSSLFFSGTKAQYFPARGIQNMLLYSLGILKGTDATTPILTLKNKH